MVAAIGDHVLGGLVAVLLIVLLVILIFRLA